MTDADLKEEIAVVRAQNTAILKALEKKKGKHIITVSVCKTIFVHMWQTIGMLSGF